MVRHQWTPRQLKRFVAPVPRRSGYPSLMLRMRADRLPDLPPGLYRHFDLPDVWARWREVFEAADHRCKYLGITRLGPWVWVEWYGYTTHPGDSSIGALPLMRDLIHAFQAAGVRVDVCGWRRKAVRP